MVRVMSERGKSVALLGNDGSYENGQDSGFEETQETQKHVARENDAPISTIEKELKSLGNGQPAFQYSNDEQLHFINT